MDLGILADVLGRTPYRFQRSAKGLGRPCPSLVHWVAERHVLFQAGKTRRRVVHLEQLVEAAKHLSSVTRIAALSCSEHLSRIACWLRAMYLVCKSLRMSASTRDTPVSCP